MFIAGVLFLCYHGNSSREANKIYYVWLSKQRGQINSWLPLLIELLF